ncbi:MAG: dTDP-glucose 4,6-dehydratase [Devosia sp.]|nr:dTDP-glucose 4,6-dehydratase [Devosia sp.]
MSNPLAAEVHLITGGAGFIGVNLAAALLERGCNLVILDNFSRGSRANLGALADDPRVGVAQVDCSDAGAIEAGLTGFASLGTVTEIWHLAANSDIPAGIADPRIDLTDTFLTTFAVLQVMAARGIETLNFASTGAVYGDLGDVELRETSAPLEPISNYGAMKLASEVQIRAAVEAFLGRANIFRFPNVVGVPATHGVIYDFVGKLLADPSRLEVLGDGTQRKPYFHCDTLVEAMLFIRDRSALAYGVYNIGPSDAGVTVKWIAETVADVFGGEPEIVYGRENRGWVGDVPKFRYNTDKLRQLGWTAEIGSQASVRKAIEQIVALRRS